MGRYPDAWMDLLLSKSDIVSVVSSYVVLKSKGRRLWGVCPFHSEKTPSFSVTPDKQLYHCFGCGAGGGVVQFIMEIERLPYTDAIQFLAQRAGMELPEEVNDEQLRRERIRKERLYEACKLSALFFHKQLKSPEGAPARAYLQMRGLKPHDIAHFGIGYAPDGWNNLLLHLKEKGFSEVDLLDAGLVNQKGARVYDAYRNRVIFPIIGMNARVLGFGARSMGDALPKYINTSETPIYNKRRNLYGMNRLKSQKIADIVIVEGYMDVISLYAAGIKNAVASLGTSLTVQQARLIKRFVSTAYIAYDGDAAGQNATLRGLEILEKEGLQVKVIVLPEGKDPDDFVREQGKEAFDLLRDQALALNAFKLTQMGVQYDLSTEDGRQEYALAGCRFIATLQPVEQERYLLQLSRATGFTAEALKEQGKRTNAAAPAEPVITRPVSRKRVQEETGPRDVLELALLKTLVQSPEIAVYIHEQGLHTLFQNEAYRSVAEHALEKEAPQDIQRFMSMLEGAQADQLAKALYREEPVADPFVYAQDCIGRMKKLDIMREIHDLQAKASGDTVTLPEKQAYLQRITELERDIRLFK